NTLLEDIALLLGLGLQNPEGQFLLFEAAVAGYIKLFCHILQIVQAAGLKVGEGETGILYGNAVALGALIITLGTLVIATLVVAAALRIPAALVVVIALVVSATRRIAPTAGRVAAR